MYRCIKSDNVDNHAVKFIQHLARSLQVLARFLHKVANAMAKGAFTRAILRVGGLLHLTADTQKAVGQRVSLIGTCSTSTS